MHAITEIYRHHVLHGLASFETESPLLADMCRRCAEVLAKGLPYLVADVDGGTAGYTYAGIVLVGRDTAENSVYLQDDKTRRSIGWPLLEALILECEVRDLRQMMVVNGDSATLPRSTCMSAMVFAMRARCLVSVTSAGPGWSPR